jgi:hypothetical protein
MTTENHPARTLPDQPAANSGGAVGFLLGCLAGIALTLLIAAQPGLNAYATPLSVMIGACVLGTLGGVAVGAIRDAFAR